MYRIMHGSVVIGHSALEAGDPPMGCAEGVFFPTKNFQDFKGKVAPENDGEPRLLRWTGLSLATSDGVVIECQGVVLFELDGEEWDVDAIGIGYPLYEKLFPDLVKLYEDQFK